jgi:hypothetical protein
MNYLPGLASNLHLPSLHLPSSHRVPDWPPVLMRWFASSASMGGVPFCIPVLLQVCFLTQIPTLPSFCSSAHGGLPPGSPNHGLLAVSLEGMLLSNLTWLLLEPYSLDPMTTGVGVGGSCSQAISWLLSSYNLLLSPYGHTLTYLISSEAAIVFILFYFLILIYLVRLGFDLRASCFVKQAFYCLSHTSSPCYCLLTNSDSLICCLASVFPCQKVGSLWRRVLACLVLLCPSPPPPPGPTQNGSACLLGG